MDRDLAGLGILFSFVNGFPGMPPLPAYAPVLSIQDELALWTGIVLRLPNGNRVKSRPAIHLNLPRKFSPSQSGITGSGRLSIYLDYVYVGQVYHIACVQRAVGFAVDDKLFAISTS